MSSNADDEVLGPDPDQVGYDSCSEGTLKGSNGTSDTYCDLNRANNVWVEGVVDLPNGKNGICMLDTMTADQVIYVLKHDPKAREDLKKVTSDQTLLGLLEDVPLLSSAQPADQQTRASARSGMTYYSVFKGRPPNAQFYPKKK